VTALSTKLSAARNNFDNLQNAQNMAEEFIYWHASLHNNGNKSLADEDI